MSSQVGLGGPFGLQLSKQQFYSITKKIKLMHFFLSVTANSSRI